MLHTRHWWPTLFRRWQFRVAIALAVIALVCGVIVALPEDRPAEAALQEDVLAAQVIIGLDNDNIENPTIQPPGAVDQSLDNADVILGRGGSDLIIGRLGSDTILGGPGDDVIAGGPEQFTRPNSDIMLGEDGEDIAVWAPGDGSELFFGGPGQDILIFGVIDRDQANVPLISPSARPIGPPSIIKANVSGSPGFCTLERSTDPTLGYDFLVRFFVRQTGALAVTLRTNQVERVICTSQEGGQITVADLTEQQPTFRVTDVGGVSTFSLLAADVIR